MRFPLLAKAAAVLGVTVMVFLALDHIESLVGERRMRGREAEQGIAQSHAGAQTLVGPLLQRDCTESWSVTTGEGKQRETHLERRAFTLRQTPEKLSIDGRVHADPRYRGLFKVNAYVAQFDLQAVFAGLQALVPQREHAGSTLACDEIAAMVALGDVRGVRAARVTMEGQPLAVAPGTGHAKYAHGLHAPLTGAGAAADGDPAGDRPRALRFVLEVVGTRRLAWVPAAADLQWTLQSDWPHPSFGGQFLPVTREVGDSGFQARWAVSALQTAAAADVLRGLEPCGPAPAEVAEAGEYEGPAPKAGGCMDTLSVDFIDPVNPYVLSDRAVKYGGLFIGLTFLVVALVEVLAGRRVHPLQYLLVGLSLTVFFLLLLSLSEHLPFESAYGGAAAACAVLLGFYARFMLGRPAAGAAFGAGIALLYGMLYVLLQREQDALAIGSLGVFGALAAVMFLTRRLDWYAVFAHWQAPMPAAAAAVAVAGPAEQPA